jgi:hypothetical protein
MTRQKDLKPITQCETTLLTTLLADNCFTGQFGQDMYVHHGGDALINRFMGPFGLLLNILFVRRRVALMFHSHEMRRTERQLTAFIVT